MTSPESQLTSSTRRGGGWAEERCRPAVVVQAVDVSVSPEERGLVLQLAAALAAAQAGAVPLPASSQQEEAVAHPLATPGARHWLLDGHICQSLREREKVFNHWEVKIL